VTHRWSRLARVGSWGFVLAAVVGCNPFGLDGIGDLEDARERWRNAGVSSYAYTLTRGCFCPPQRTGPVRISVSAGQVVERVYSDGTAVDPNQDLWPTMDGLFDHAERALRDAHEVTIRYDPQLGYPSEISVDWIRDAIDDEETLTVASFVSQ